MDAGEVDQIFRQHEGDDCSWWTDESFARAQAQERALGMDAAIVSTAQWLSACSLASVSAWLIR
jgi:hypothetical protein